MDISVIFATYKRHDVLSLTLESFCNLNTSGLSWEIIIVDNADDTACQELITAFIGRLPIKLVVEVKRGKNYALNKAIEVANGELYIFTDDDVIADSNWLIDMWEGSKMWPNYSVFGGRILPELPSGKIPISKNHSFFNCAYVVADWNIDEGEYSSQKVWGPNMAIRSNVFHNGWKFNTNVGPNGNNYIMGSETELTKRLEEAGMGAVYLPKSLVYHQIRSEQLEISWLYGRAFRFGRSQALETKEANVPYLFNAPRYLFRKLLEIAAKRIIFFIDEKKRIESGVDYWMLRGEIYQYMYINSN